MRRSIIALLVALLGTLAWALSAAPAQAGGPTSVLLVDRVTGRAAALYFQHPAYDQLIRSVDVDLRKAPIQRPSTVADEYDNHIMLTWLAHDVWVWRIDEVFLTDSDGIWVSTQADLTGEGNAVEQAAHWHRPADGKALLAAISATGLLPRPSRASTHHTVSPPTFPASPEPQSTSATGVASATASGRATAVPPVSSSGSSGTGGLVAAGAGVAGIVVGAGAMLLYHRARSPRPEPPDRFVLTG